LTRYAIGLGSNLGDRLAHLRSAVAAVSDLGTDLVVSGLYETAPVGGPIQGPYLNAVVTIENDLSALDLLSALYEIETDQGRVRRERWSERTLDLDIISSDGPPISQPTLVVPHPRASERRFVLQPLVDVWPSARVGNDLEALQALALTDDQDVDMLTTHWAELRAP
jgi:2-amino-4-hydroxy-6-hydroxymethyldihydropteridine diphosphokinase